MVIYADILMLLNFLVDYFIISATKHILRRKAGSFRTIMGAAVGGVGSLYIFLPVDTYLFDLLFKLLICSVSVLIVFGFKSLKKFAKAFLVLFLVNCSYAGIMTAFWHIFKPKGMAVINSVVYFNISPLFLIVATVAAYLLFVLLYAVFSRVAKNSGVCTVTLFADGVKTDFNAIVDTGNSISDTFGKSEIIIADRRVAVALFGNCDTQSNINLRPRYRVVPCRTVAGSDLLEGYRCDKAKIKSNGKTITLEKPILALSKIAIEDGFEGIVNPDILG